jgi:glucose-6-phosphate 1-dehydrogenase
MNQLAFDRTAKTAVPDCLLVIFGASGDLTKRLLMPALYNLSTEGLLTSRFSILCIGHHTRTDEEFRASMAESLREHAEAGKSSLDDKTLQELMSRVTYLAGAFEDPNAYAEIKKRLLTWAEAGAGQANAIFYLATAPNYFGDIIEKLGQAELLHENETTWRRIIIEKPFGHDLASARALNARILEIAAEHQIYRMDHFLGKETVQNIMVLRFANFMFEPIWNREHIDHIQITAAESIGVEQRGKFYDQTGALRDMVPNHMFQLLAMMTMEAPNSFHADAIRAEKAKVIEAIRRLSPDEAIRNIVRGQYISDPLDPKKLPSYTDVENVSPQSQTETYIAMKLYIDNWRWMDVPFYIRTGKALRRRRTEIVIQFKRAPGVLFREMDDEKLSSCRMIFHIQPEEGITLRFAAKEPGRKVQLADVNMEFRYGDYFKTAPSTGYETLIYDCLVGDATLFQRADNVEAGWAGVQPIIDSLSLTKGKLHPYQVGSDGPIAADMLLHREGRAWLPLH